MCQVLSWRKRWSQPDSYCSYSPVTFRCSAPCWLSCSSTDFPTLFSWCLWVQLVPTVLSKHFSYTEIPLIVSTKATGFSPVCRQQNLLLWEKSLRMESERNHMTQKRISLQEVFGLYHFVKASLERGENNKVKHISGLKPIPK